MHRILLEEPHIGSYRAFLLAGIFFGYLLARWRAKKSGVEGRHIDNIGLLIAVLGIAGARFFSRLFYYPTPLSFWEALKLWEGGGLVFYGGMIFGIVTVLVYAVVRKLSIPRLMDVLAPSLALGLAFGRVGCFMAGCCWGDICGHTDQIQAIANPVTRVQLQTFPAVSPEGFPLAVRFPAEAGAFKQHHKLGLIAHDETRSLPVHPAQLYEAFLALVICVAFSFWFEKRRRDGEIFCAVGITYGFVRFALEFIRADSKPVYFHGITVSQSISLMLIASFVLFLIVQRILEQRKLTAGQGQVAEVPLSSELRG